MKRMSSNISIGNYAFENRVTSVQIDLDRRNIAGKAKIQLPNLQGRLEQSIKVGDPVKIQLGYDGQLRTEFEGYVSRINPKIPVEIECEDEAFNLKRSAVKPMAWKSVKLIDVLKYLFPEVQANVYDITLSPFRIESSVKNAYEALDKIKNEFGFDIYFREGVLVAGLAYSEVMDTVVLHLQKNAKADQLEFRRKDDIKLQIKAISLNSRNEKIEAEAGDSNGEIHTLHYYNLTKAELQKIANEKVNTLKYDGYRGKVLCKGFPYTAHGMVAELINDLHPQLSGKYFLDAVSITYNGSSGYSRQNELGRRADD